MWLKILLLLAPVLTFPGPARVASCPGMGKTLDELSSLSSLQKRQTSQQAELLADLKMLADDALSVAGWTIKHILLLNRTAVLPNDIKTTYQAPGPLGSPECGHDTCCIWKHIAEEMAASFKAPLGQCNELARQAVRLGFQDAGTWSKTAGGGGADGSVLLAADEWRRPDNLGLEGIAPRMQAWYDQWRHHGAGMADLIQMAANVATVSCPLGPRVRSFVGRNDSSEPAPEGRLPHVTDGAETLAALFEDKTIDLSELTALIGAHSVSTQRLVGRDHTGALQDGVPGVWDVSWYNKTLGENTPPGMLILQSDLALAAHQGAQEVWAAFAKGAKEAQDAWNDVSFSCHHIIEMKC